jgi:Gpi18-like mannosyltransferase
LTKVIHVTATAILRFLEKPAYACNWDCYWYLSIVEKGYQLAPNIEPPIGAANWAFFPLVPTSVKLLKSLIPIDPFIIAVIVNSIAFLLSLYVLERILSENKKLARQTSLLIAISPIGIYVNSFYTESVYFLLTCLIAYHLKKENLIWASAFAGMISATRVTGIFISIFVIICLLRAAWKKKIRVTEFVLASLMSFSGIGLFSIYLKYLTGDYLAFLHIQKAWGVGNKNFIEWVRDALTFYSPTQFIYLILFILTLFLVVYLIIKKKYFEALVTAIPVITTIVSAAVNLRYFLVSYAAYVFISSKIQTSKKVTVVFMCVTLIATMLGDIAWQSRLGFMI